VDALHGAATPYAAPSNGVVAVYRNVTLFDGTGRPPRSGTTIVTDGPMISTVGDDRVVSAGLPNDAQVFDLEGRFVTPGLIDAHQHLATPPDRPRTEALLRRLIYSGVTAIREMANDLRHVSDVARSTLVGEIPGPDIRYAALMAGAGFFDDPRAHAVALGETPGAVPWLQAITDQTDLRLAVAMARGTNAAAIKIYADLDGSAVAAITAEAHRQGIKVWAHATVFPATPGEVVQAGVDVISHSTLLGHEGGSALQASTFKEQPVIDHSRFMAGDNRDITKLFDQMKRRGTILDATVASVDRPYFSGHGPEAEGRARTNAELAAVLTAQAHLAGVMIVTGTDYETETADPFPALYQELEALVHRCRIPPEDVLRFATLVGARSAGTETIMGSVEPGKMANFAVFTEDPVRAIENIRSITLTVRRGHRYERAEFESGAAGAA
jgi:imidazolonepropionase-like amidohydrolase